MRDWAVVRLVGAEVPLLGEDQRERLLRIPELEPKQMLALLAAVAEAEKMAKTNVTPSLVADYLRMQLSGSKNSASSA